MDRPAHNRPESSWNLGIPTPETGGLPPRQRFVINFKAIVIFVLLLAGTFFTASLVNGLLYAFGLLLILGTHEFGHYWACRRNNVDASLPNFLPAPPYFIIGTFGAFIIIKEPIPNRKALMEIGASGPIAGFLMTFPVLIYGLLNSDIYAIPPLSMVSNLEFGNSIGMILLTELVLGVNPLAPDLTIVLHPLAYAGWLGLFFTALNLLPMGQLDGGHVVYAMFGQKHVWIARGVFLTLLVLGYFWLGWYVWAAMVLLMGLKHPPVIYEEEPLSPLHRKIGYASLFIFIFTFVPVPIDFIA